MKLGDWTISVLRGSSFKLDGGGMFGVVPRPVWSRLAPPDEAGRIAMQANCLLIRTETEIILVDSGIGTKMPSRDREFLAIETGEPLLQALAEVGVAPEMVSHVVLTHLHMDHAGGCSRWVAGSEELPVDCFPNASYHVQRQEWEDARINRSHMRITYRQENLDALQRSGRLELLEGASTILPGLSVRVTGGHTRGHQAVILEHGGSGLYYLADIVPTFGHSRKYFTMAYDLDPLHVIEERQRWFAEAAETGWPLVLGHEPGDPVCRVHREAGVFHLVRSGDG